LGWELGFVSEEALEKSHVIEGYPKKGNAKAYTI
jgi:hypothetical protein